MKIFSTQIGGIKFLSVVIALMGLYLLFLPGRALAFTHNGENIPIGVQYGASVTDCMTPNGQRKYGEYRWISPANQPATDLTYTTIDAGTDSIDLQINILTFVCNNNFNNLDASGVPTPSSSIITKTHSRTNVMVTNQSTSLGSLTDIRGQSSVLDTYNVAYAYEARFIKTGPSPGAPQSFRFTLSGLRDLNAGDDYDIDLNIITNSIHEYIDGTYACVAQTPVVDANYLDFINPSLRCGSGGASSRLKVHINEASPNKPQGDFDLSCDSLTTRSLSDLDSLSTQLQWRVFVDGTSTQVGSGTGNNHSVNITSRKDWRAHTFTLRIFDVDEDGALTGSYVDVTKNVGPCVSPKCRAITPAFANVGDNFSINLGYDYSGGGSGSPLPAATVTLRSYVATPSSAISLPAGQSLPWAKGGVTTGFVSFDNFMAVAKGEVIFTWQISWPAGGPSTITCVNNGTTDGGGIFHTYAPAYLKVYGNDVISGGEFSDGTPGQVCSAQKDIKAFATGSGNDWRGSSVQFAASATGTITGFFSGGMNNSGNSSAAPIGLTHGNYNGSKISPVLSNMGGNSLLGSGCIPDYYALASDPASGAAPIAGTLGGDPGAEVSYRDGDLTISNNINASQSWSHVDQVQNRYIIVRGDIFINPGVINLDGIYIAQPKADGTGGRIITCNSNDLASCKNQLTINGAFIAKEVIFNRHTDGTVSNAGVNEGPGSPGASEVFNFSPEIYLNPSDVLNGDVNNVGAGSGSITGYDFIIALPPIL